MKKRWFIFVIILSLFIIIAGCASKTDGNYKDSKIAQLHTEINSYENDIAQLKEELNNYELNINELQEESENYKEFIEFSIKYLDDDELSVLAKNCWSYKINMDDNPMNLNDVKKTDIRNFKITYSERMYELSNILKEEIINKGRISGNFYDHLTFIDIQPTKTYITDGTVVQGMHYEFENVPKGTVIKMAMTDELKERLALDDNTIGIEVN